MPVVRPTATIPNSVSSGRLLPVAVFRRDWAGGMGHATFYDAIARGELTAVKVGRRTMIATSEAERWLKSLPKLVSRKIVA